jgi:hypothetical protein
MNQYNVINILYLIFRLAPIIFIFYFLLQSMFNMDYRGLILLIGLVLSSIVASILGQLLSVGMGDEGQLGQSYRCNTFYLGNIPIGGGLVQPLSKIPLNILMYGYTLAYLITSFIAPPVTYTNALVALQQNIAMLILFPLFLLFEILWTINNSCNREIYIALALGIGIGGGVAWAYLIRLTKDTRLQYLNLGNVEVCSRPSKTIYKCRNINS